MMAAGIQAVTIGYSPCPNDTFIFYALTHGIIDLPGMELAAPLLEDVETLNSMALEHRLDVTKLSFHALGMCWTSIVYCRRAAPWAGAAGLCWWPAPRWI